MSLCLTAGYQLTGERGLLADGVNAVNQGGPKQTCLRRVVVFLASVLAGNR